MLLKDQDSFINDENSQLNLQQETYKRQLKAFKMSYQSGGSRDALVQINSLPEEAFQSIMSPITNHSELER